MTTATIVPVDVNPAAAIRRIASYQPTTPAIGYPGIELDYATLDDRAARLAAVLAGRGIRAGDRVAYAGLNSPAFLLTLFATVRLGAVFVPVNFRLAGPELQGVLAGSGAVALVAEEGHRAVVDSVREHTALRELLLVDDDAEIPAPPEPDAPWEPWSRLLQQAQPDDDVVARGFDDPAVLMFTSGTTGAPKGVTLTHGNIWWNGVNVDTRLHTRRDDVTYGVAPLFHIGGLNALLLRTLTRGGTAVLRRSFDPPRFLADLVEQRVNSFFAVPAMLAALARVPGIWEADLSALHSVVVAAAPVPPSLIEQYAAHGILLQQAWGLTETAPFATHLPAEYTMRKLGSAGIAMPHTEVGVVDPATNTAVAPGEPGEIVVRGPNVTPGYWNNPAATAAAFDAEGWFHSGDIGYLDADGFLYIVDRLKDMIISGGENIYPAEVENALADLPGVIDVAVVGADDPQWGETVVAVLCIAEGSEVGLEAVREHAARRLARYKLPRRVQFVDALPRNASGKLDKRAVRALLRP
ncbi:long-chain-fatty-acid--CoA ligase [Nocardia asteroides]|uniref:long-chain-fatty-acid--CoA ligase n=1 Tax=Nocardia asteroides TaxID=1824 RepID=UPI001E2EA79C|nr:long-chain-fatty-acid--CoA ligase [Nocardia asteroides]UGT62679.1 long-chain-fatty-acid--CoA ligase [Nocardia asteroides]